MVTALPFILPLQKSVDNLVNYTLSPINKSPLEIYHRGKNATTKEPLRKPPPPLTEN